MKFGEFVKNRRIGLGLTLRSFCREIGHDASNWSKIERGVIAPPQDARALDKIASLLGLDANGRTELEDLSFVARGQLPTDLQSDEIQAKLPAFFRAIRGQEYVAEDVTKLIEGVKKLHQP
jgi:transcriptional regulator with XRE-family HTH domain